MAIADTGVRTTCPGCGQTVMQKAMIPVLATGSSGSGGSSSGSTGDGGGGGGGGGMTYLCIPCARLAVVTRAETAI
jgi:hypothetical protein